MGLDSWPGTTLRTVNDLQVSHEPKSTGQGADSSLSRRVGLPFFFSWVLWVGLKRRLLSVCVALKGLEWYHPSGKPLALLPSFRILVLPRCCELPWKCTRRA
jgi:hypothetical protein